MLIKKIAGFLMLIIGLFGLLSTWLLNTGHTSSSTTLTDDILPIVFSILLLIAGIYALTTGKKPNKIKR